MWRIFYLNGALEIIVFKQNVNATNHKYTTKRLLKSGTALILESNVFKANRFLFAFFHFDSEMNGNEFVVF